MGFHGGGHLVQQFFVEELSQETVVTGEELQHMQVLRLQIGEEIFLTDGTQLAKGKLLCLDKKEARVELLEYLQSTEPPYNITLYQGLPKGEKMEVIIQKAVELGVKRIVPVQTARSVVKWDKERSKNKIERFNRVALGACKQSHRVVRPEVTEPISFAEFLPEWQSFTGLKLAFWEEGNASLPEAMQEIPKDVAILIGPEGGLSKEEAISLQSPLFTLGPRILRTETASVAALAMLLFALELKGENHSP